MLNQTCPASFAEEIRPDETHAAIRIGFLLRQIEHVSAEVWVATSLPDTDVDHAFQELDRELITLSRRVNTFEAGKLSALRRQVTTWFAIAIDIRAGWERAKPPFDRNDMRLQTEKDPEARGVQKHQKDRLDELRKIWSNIVRDDTWLSAWLEIGDRLGNTIYRLLRGELSDLSLEELDLFFSGVNRLPPDIRRRVQPFFPVKYDSATHLAAELLETYNGLCHLISRTTFRPDDVKTNVATKETVYSTSVMSPRELAYLFGLKKSREGARAFLTLVKEGTYRVKKITSRKYLLALDDFPQTHPESPRYKPAVTTK